MFGIITFETSTRIVSVCNGLVSIFGRFGSGVLSPDVSNGRLFGPPKPPLPELSVVSIGLNMVLSKCDRKHVKVV
jgi:hypothetical protein